MTELPLNSPDSKRALPSWLSFLYSGEDYLLALVLAAMMILPLAELVLRRVANVGITGSSSFVQHLTLLVGVLGGALAARESRLLTLSSLANFLPGGWRAAAMIFNRSVATALSVVLCIAGWQFVLAEPGDKILA